MICPKKKLQDAIREICQSLPETQQGDRFREPGCKARKKNFCMLHFCNARLKLSTREGFEQQATYTYDPRFNIPKYTEINGAVEIDIHKARNLNKIWVLIRKSDRHFELKYILKVSGQEQI